MNTERIASEGVRIQVETIRKKLLDLSLRNRMLNYRPSKRLGVSVLGENSFQVHRLLVEESKPMSFVGKPDPRRDRPSQPELPDFSDEVAMQEFRKAAEEELDAFVNYASAPVDQTDTKLSTDEFESILQAKLRNIMREATLANDELGINTLFLTLGTLEWCETQERSYRAPLLFVPVELKLQANGAIRIMHDGSDVGTNLPLRAKVSEFNFKLPELDEEKSLLDYFSEVESTIRKRDDWAVHRDEICLGFFNYEKYAMYVDLGGESWPEGGKPWNDSDLIAMLGESYPHIESSIDDRSFIDDHRPVAECHEVYDADSSQTLAMIRAAAGHSIVIEGPPGTGKSQTITNIIAETVAAGKTVLFVSAKRAALDVVKRRLAEAELGDICLDLHDKFTNRREFYSEIKRTVGMHLHVPEQQERVKRLTELRDRLNGHCRAVNEEVNPYGVTPFSAMSILAGLEQEFANDREGRIPFEQLKHIKHREIPALKQSLHTLQTRIGESGVPCQHPFWGVQLSYVDPAIRLDLEEELRVAIDAIRESLAALHEASVSLKVPSPSTAEEVEYLRICAERALNAPPLDGVAVGTDSWKSEETIIRNSIAMLRQRKEIKSNGAKFVQESAWTTDTASLLTEYDKHAGKWYKFLISDFRRARRSFSSLLIDSGSLDIPAQHAMLRDLKVNGEIEAFIESKESTLSGIFGVQWKGLDSDPHTLTHLTDWVLTLLTDVSDGKLPAGLIDLLSGTHVDSSLLRLVERAEASTEATMQAYKSLAKTLIFPAETCRTESIVALQKRINDWNVALPRLSEYMALMEARRTAIEKGLTPVVEVADHWPQAADRLCDAFVRSYYTGVVREAVETRPDLRRFERISHEAAIAEYQRLDDFKLRYNRARVRLVHYENIPRLDNAVGNLYQLKVQCELQRKHKPIRWIMSRAGEAIQRIKPVFMMSPLSVAIHLPPELPTFDVVIFDEASQVKPEDALCAIIRAKQTIVVGDTRQMPPTSFFDRVADDELDEEEGEDASAEFGREASKLESVLSLMTVAATSHARRPDLQWHYRSLHPSLIQPSNELFYENRLIVFPSPGVEANGSRIGIVFHHHPETIYEGGDRKRFNRQEAELVAQAVVSHIQECGDQSLMVAAMNKAQADLIYSEVEKQKRLYPEAFEAFGARHPHESLEVKNLENVQGDERDVVFISITYGRDSSGVIRQQFGPILRDGGERRLNVLISRARMRCQVFSNITADDLRVEPNQRGLVALKRYLNFAQSGRTEVPLATGKEEESPFEEEVSAVLRDRGYQVDTQVGTAGCRIDLAVIDPESPGRYILGVECDGASYHSSRSARDRDKLRQVVLESRGWTLHRIWSTDWWQNRQAEINRLVEAIEQAIKPITWKPAPVEEPQPEVLVEHRSAPVATARVQAYKATPSATVYTEEDLKRYVVRVVAYEGPITHELLTIRLRDGAGFFKTSAKTRIWLNSLISEALASNSIRQLEKCYVIDDSQLTRARDWSDQPTSERRFDLISDLEICNAISLVIQGAYGVSVDEAIREGYALLGFKRASEETKSRARNLLEQLISNGKIQVQGDSLFIKK